MANHLKYFLDKLTYEERVAFAAKAGSTVESLRILANHPRKDPIECSLDLGVRLEVASNGELGREDLVPECGRCHHVSRTVWPWYIGQQDPDDTRITKERGESILGQCINDPDFYRSVSYHLTPDDFYVGHHRMIWRAMYAVSLRGDAPSVPLVVDELVRVPVDRTIHRSLWIRELCRMWALEAPASQGGAK